MDEQTKQHIQDAIEAGDINAVRAIVNGPAKYEPKLSDVPTDAGEQSE